jgi:integrase
VGTGQTWWSRTGCSTPRATATCSRTSTKAYRLLHAIFETAAEDDRIIPRNPCHIDGAGKEESDERQIVPLPVVFEIAKAVPARYHALVLLATFADMRWGELAGLRRENLDLDACEIRIKETLSQPDKGALRTDTPKSQAGKRTVSFPAEIAPRSGGTSSGSLSRGAGNRLRRPEGRPAAPLEFPQVDLDQGPRKGRPARSPLPRPAPHGRDPHGGDGRDAQGADGSARALQHAGCHDLSARH